MGSMARVRAGWAVMGALFAGACFDTQPIDLGTSDEDIAETVSEREDDAREQDTTEDGALEQDATRPACKTASSTPADLRPVAVIDVAEDDTVVPQTILHLSGASSYSARGAIRAWSWEVDQPVGSTNTFQPGPDARTPAFQTNVAGVYTFRLTVLDETGEASCVPAELSVYVVPDQALHVELLWSTPGDPDESDEVGADLDLHFVDPLAAPPGYFNIPFDCFWANKQPNWGSIDATAGDDPGLDLDDTDGRGPENLNFDRPEEGKRYCLAAHVWDDRNFGPSYATVRIYQHGNLTFERTDVALAKHDLWEVACIAWPGAIVEDLAAGGTEKITHDFMNADFLQP